MSWNGHAGAVSLTFDDGLNCQLDNAMPLLGERGIAATFFLPVNDIFNEVDRRQEWKLALTLHEVGSHSVNHLKAATLTAVGADYEARASRNFLRQWSGQPVKSFCYPYTDAIPVIQDAVRVCGYSQARGGRVASQNKFVTKISGHNPMNLPCFHLGPQTIDFAEDWCKEAERQQAWFTVMIHGIGQEGTWDNLETERFARFLDLLQRHDLWVEPFDKAADWWRR